MLILIGIIPTTIAVGIVVRSYEDRAVNLRTTNVRNQCDIFCNTVISQHYLDDPTKKDVFDRELSTLSSIYNGRLLIVDSNFRVLKDTFDIDTGKTSVSQEVISCFRTGTGSTYYDDKNAYIEITAPISEPGSSLVRGVLVASISTNEIVQTVKAMEQQGLMVSALVSMLVFVAGVFLADLLLRPFGEITKSIEDVTDGLEDEAISVKAYTETEQITDAFNRMLARVRALDNTRQEFVSNVSHELKTPLTSMKVLADSLNSMPDAPIEIYQEFMSDITKEIDRENSIISDLLSMVRMDKKAAVMNYERTDIGDLLAQIMKRLTPIADKADVELVLESYKPVFADVDVTKLSLALSNLIENGIKYNKAGGWVRVTLKSDQKYFYINVADSGMGIPEDQIDRVFERFYRVDKSHSTEIEGTGLGLAITKSAITLHRGVIKLTSKQGEGTTFMVRIPLVREDN